MPLPVVLPLLGAARDPGAGRAPRAQRLVSLAVLTAVLGVSAALLAVVCTDGPQVVAVGGWPVPLGIVLVADQLSALMLVVSTTVSLGVLVYAIGQGMAEGGEETPMSIFHPTFLILIAGVSNAFLAGDLFNLYVGFEILLTASYVLLTLGGTGDRMRAGTTYVVVSLLSSLIFLAAIALIYAATGTVNMAELAGRLDALPDGHPADAAVRAAGRVRHQGGGVPAVGLAARLLSDRARAGHRGVRRPAHQGRHLRDHPHRRRCCSRPGRPRPAADARAC